MQLRPQFSLVWVLADATVFGLGWMLGISLFFQAESYTSCLMGILVRTCGWALVGLCGIAPRMVKSRENDRIHHTSTAIQNLGLCGALK